LHKQLEIVMKRNVPEVGTTKTLIHDVEVEWNSAQSAGDNGNALPQSHDSVPVQVFGEIHRGDADAEF
jgi:hypothetical protein